MACAASRDVSSRPHAQRPFFLRVLASEVGRAVWLVGVICTGSEPRANNSCRRCRRSSRPLQNSKYASSLDLPVFFRILKMMKCTMHSLAKNTNMPRINITKNTLEYKFSRRSRQAPTMRFCNASDWRQDSAPGPSNVRH